MVLVLCHKSLFKATEKNKVYMFVDIPDRRIQFTYD